MGLKLYNTLTRTKENFVPIKPDHIRMYVCGPTVYDFAHIGNARPLIVFDVLFRLLRYVYGADQVTYVRNITDVEDKINARAAEEFPDRPLNEAIREVTTRTTEQFHTDVAALGCLPPTIEPRATEYINRPAASTDMIRLIGQLVDKGYAYPAEGHVLFDVKSWKAADGSSEYGKLARRSLDDMIAGARVEVAPYKKDPMDFVLWKPSTADEPGWDSPWGLGRPGWHLECSAMAGALLGETFDIHGGGIDLVFPHHENEIAQSRCAHGTSTMANVWMHNGFLQVEGEKMSKSLGNFVTIRDLLETEKFGGRRWPGEVLRLAMLRTHYREPIDWTVAKCEEAEGVLNRWYKWLEAFHVTGKEIETARPADAFLTAIQDDLNTPAAVSELHRLAKMASGVHVESVASAEQLGPETKELLATGAFGGRSNAVELAASARLLGLMALTPEEWQAAKSSGRAVDDVKVDLLISARAAARKAKDWVEADRIRDELDAMGLQLNDAKNPETGELVTTWEIKR
ncbi:MAG: cysteine--tRNA ligase [Hyphomicrobiales bacterium]|nr:cysteine--tRNA ligase [Hyphomicrobiales bacterium]